jgi:hypothetical protein
MTDKKPEPVTEGEVQEFAADVDKMLVEAHQHTEAELQEIDQAVADYKAAQTIVQRSSEAVEAQYQVIGFKGRAMVMVRQPYPHYVPLHKDRFEKLAYPILGGVTRSRMNDVFAYLCNSAVDLTANQNLILFGVPLHQVQVEADTDLAAIVKNPPTVWDMEQLTIRAEMRDTKLDTPTDGVIWRSPYAKVPNSEAVEAGVRDKKTGKINFIMQLANGDDGVYDDIMKSMAPMVMARKPDGVIWWVGAGANGKSTLMDALYHIFPGQLASITVKRLEDGRDTPSLNGQLANIVKESSEGRVQDTEVYKAIGTHENFRVHKFHSQDDIEIQGNMHHIFSANIIPSFNDKGYAARRRTFIIPFKAKFDSDPTFEDRTFTPEFFGALIVELCKYANVIAKDGYKYKFSALTQAAKTEYDAEASNAEEYMVQLINGGVVAFDNFGSLKSDYENWCIDEGYVPLGVGNLKRATNAFGFERMSVKTDGGQTVSKKWKLAEFTGKDLEAIGMGRPGLYRDGGAASEETPDWVADAKAAADNSEAKQTEMPVEPVPLKKKTVLGDKW